MCANLTTFAIQGRQEQPHPHPLQLQLCLRHNLWRILLACCCGRLNDDVVEFVEQNGRLYELLTSALDFDPHNQSISLHSLCVTSTVISMLGRAPCVSNFGDVSRTVGLLCFWPTYRHFKIYQSGHDCTPFLRADLTKRSFLRPRNKDNDDNNDDESDGDHDDLITTPF